MQQPQVCNSMKFTLRTLILARALGSPTKAREKLHAATTSRCSSSAWQLRKEVSLQITRMSLLHSFLYYRIGSLGKHSLRHLPGR